MTVDDIPKGWHRRQTQSPVDGSLIHYGVMGSDPKTASFRILFLNGRSEWIEKYSDLPSLLKIGKDVSWVTLDHRGQGMSEGPRSYVRSYEDYTQDVSHIIKLTFGDLPFSIVAHSMGGLIALLAVMTQRIKPQAMVLCSPLFALPEKPIPTIIANPLSHAMKRLSLGKLPTGVGKNSRKSFSNNALTNSYQGFLKTYQSPFPYTPPTFGWVASTFDACKVIFDENAIKNLSCPVRILFGSEESVINAGVYPKWMERGTKFAPRKPDCIKIIHGKHELLNEVPQIRDHVFNLISEWLLRFH